MKKMCTLSLEVTKLVALALGMTALVLVPINSQAANVEKEGTTAVWISNLEVDGTFYNVSFTAGNWQDAYSDPPEFDVTPTQAPLFVDKINDALNISRASSVGERGAILDTGFYMIGTAINTEPLVSWLGGYYVEELPSSETFGAWISEINGLIFEGASEVGTWANISVIPGSGDQPLDVRKAGDGTGTVTSAPAGIDCGSTCTRTGYMFDTGTSITLTAKPDAGSVFTQWSGCDQTDTNTCTIEMTAAKAVTATFKKSSNAEIIVSWDNGIWYWDVAASQWTQMEDSATDGDIAAGEFTGDDIADVASSWPSGLWYQDGDTLEWTRVTRSAATRLTAGDITGDGLSEIIGSWDSGLWYRNVALSTWNLITPFYGGAPLVGDIAAGDFTDDGRADVAFIFLSDIILIDMTINRTIPIQDRTGVVPKSVTTGDVTGDGRDEIIVSFDDGIWYWDVTAQQWTQMWHTPPDGDIAAGDFNGDGFADVASIWPSGLWYQDGANLAWTKIPVDASDGPSGVPNRLTAGEVTEPPSGDLVKVFVTSVPSTGNLGGLAGADQFCETRAAAADLSGTGTWTAWLSDDAEDAIGRIPDGQYTLVDGTVIADDKNDLTDSMLNAAINLDEFGGGAGASSVWTGTQPDGTSVPPDSVFGKSSNCSNWTSSEQETSCTAGGDDNCAVRGNRSSMDATWTFVGTPGTSGALTGCSVPNSLYCFGSE